MSERLNKRVKERIIRAALEHALSKREEESREEEHRLAIEARDRALGKDLHAFLRLPGDLVMGSPSAQTVNVGGPVYRLQIPKGSRSCPRRLDLTADDELGKRVVVFENRKQDLVAERAELREHVQAILDSVRTVKRLLEVWPEARKFVPEGADSGSGQALVNVRYVNQRLGLAEDERA